MTCSGLWPEAATGKCLLVENPLFAARVRLCSKPRASASLAICIAPSFIASNLTCIHDATNPSPLGCYCSEVQSVSGAKP